MTSFVFIELDTRPPEIEIYAPSYTDFNIINNITVKSDENLSDFQNIYLIDSSNNRHDYTFDKKDDRTLVGSIIFNNVPKGMITIYVELEDDVGNRSNLFNKSINIKESTSLLILNIKDDNILSIDNSDSNVFNIVEKSTVREIIIKRGVIDEG